MQETKGSKVAEISQSSGPIFLELSRMIADGILRGAYPPGTQVPSTTELATFFKINPITAGHALTQLAERGILEKRRGIGTFVTADALEVLHRERIDAFVQRYVDPLIEESHILGIPLAEVLEKISARNASIRDQTPPPFPHVQVTRNSAGKERR